MSDSNSGAGYANDLLASQLKNLLSDEVSESDIRWSYRKAAAVLSFFDMENIHPTDGLTPDRTQALESLYSDSLLIYDENRRPHWMLRGDTRKDALKRLGNVQNIKVALDANPQRPDDPLQQALEAYVFQRAKPLESQDHQGLLNTLQVAEWLNGLVAGVPEPQTVVQKIEIQNFLASFRFLVGDHFRGREDELSQLSEYVGVMSASGLSALISRGFRYVTNQTTRPPLVIHGPGGVGKSTLLAKFILDHLLLRNPDSPDSAPRDSLDTDPNRFPFAYLDFDRASLIAEEPVTLLIEAVRQLEIQFPESAVSLKKVRDEWNRRIGSRSVRKREPQGTVPKPIRVDNRDLFLQEFAEEIKPLTIGEKPLLLVLDTFEEVQYRSKAFVEELFVFLHELQQLVPTLRTVLSGRAPVESSFPTEALPMSIFDPKIAEGFLLSHGVTDPELAKLVAAQVGGSPLTLKLAVQLLRGRPEEAGAKGIKDLRVRDSLLRRLEDGAIQVQLFTRILEHIHDPEVRKLAHPGLVLRRITPELILRVLAKPCGVEVKDMDQAKSLFEELSKEVALVSQAGDNSLEHRSDLRKVMLEPLRKDKREKVEEIHRAAVEYYSVFDDGISRAEEIYHRLSLGIEREILEERWQDGVQHFLNSAIEELPVKAKAFLAARLGIDIDETVWPEAELEDWEIHTEQRVRDLMDLRQPLPALAALRQRSQRSAKSHLPALEKDVLITALASMQGYFSTYNTLRIKRATMNKLYQSLLGCLGKSVSAEDLVSIRRTLKITAGGSKTNEATQSTEN